MQTSDLLRHQVIESLTAPHPEKGVESAIALWAQMAVSLISIVGDGGFNSLYARSVFLTQPTFPWLADTTLSPQANHRFTQLKTSYEGQTPAVVHAANCLLLITFTDILAVLIGEQLTISILHTAWGADARDSTGKKFKNE